MNWFSIISVQYYLSLRLFVLYSVLSTHDINSWIYINYLRVQMAERKKEEITPWIVDTFIQIHIPRKKMLFGYFLIYIKFFVFKKKIIWKFVIKKFICFLSLLLSRYFYMLLTNVVSFFESRQQQKNPYYFLVDCIFIASRDYFYLPFLLVSLSILAFCKPFCR